LFVSDRCLGLVESLAEFYPDCGHSALMLTTARLRYIAGTKWSSRCYMDMAHLYALERDRPSKEKSTA